MQLAFGVATGSFPVTAAAGKRIRYSGYIRTKDMTAGWAGLWWRVDGQNRDVLAFDNMEERPATGTTDWTRYEIELQVPAGAKGISFGVLRPGNGTASFDSLEVQLDGKIYTDDGSFDLGFESPVPHGFHTSGEGYDVKLDRTLAHSGQQSLRITSIK